MNKLVIIAHNIRSIHNVGSVFRTAEGLGVEKLYLTGYTPYPKIEGDPRLPHEINKIDKAISKVSLGAEKYLDFETKKDIKKLVKQLKQDGYRIVALEQSKKSINLNQYKPLERIVLIIGNEVEGIDSSTLSLVDDIVEIPMLGKKESFNVVQAMAMASYYLINNS